MTSVFAGLAMLAAAATAAPQQRVYTWKDANGVTHHSQTPPPAGQDFSTRGTRADPPAPAPASRPAAPAGNPDCEAGRRNLALLDQADSGAGIDTDGDGYADQALDDAERQRQRALAEAVIARHCR